MDCDQIELLVHDLKIDRDTWQALALKYKAAFETQATHLQQLQDICFATQAELENERALQRHHQASTDGQEECHPKYHGCNAVQSETSFGTAAIYQPVSRKLSPSGYFANPLFSRIQQYVHDRDYETALLEVEGLLRGPLLAEERVEALLLKSEILRQTGPNELWDALAACSEALELCDRVSGLEVFLSRIEYQRAVIFLNLRTHCSAPEFHSIIDHQVQNSEQNLERSYSGVRRSGFDENRTVNEELLASIKARETSDKRRRQNSAQFRQRAAATVKRISLPHRWTAPRSE